MKETEKKKVIKTKSIDFGSIIDDIQDRDPDKPLDNKSKSKKETPTKK